MGKMILNGVPYGVTPKETINMKPYSETTLWENANGLSVSSPTSISLVDDINNYDTLCIIHAAGVEITFRSSQIIPVSNIDKTGNTNFGIFDVGANNYYYAVLTYIDDTHITLGSWGSQYPIIYYKIIGIKYGGNLSPIIYSTDEREVGVWTDGKPLYQKTIPITKTSTATLTDISSLNIENLVYSTGIEYPADKSLFLTLNYCENSNWYCFIEKIGNDLGIYCSSRDYQSVPYVLATIQYTKTTDVAGSGTYTTMGTPAVHYSTDEQVIGTWIDGKPLYRKTYEVTAQSTWGQGDNIIATIDSVCDVKKIDCTVLEQGILYAMPYLGGNGSFIRAQVQNGNIIFTVYNSSYGAGSVANITLEYTKTTD